MPNVIFVRGICVKSSDRPLNDREISELNYTRTILEMKRSISSFFFIQRRTVCRSGTIWEEEKHHAENAPLKKNENQAASLASDIANTALS